MILGNYSLDRIPLYTFLGSAFVTGLRWIGVAPAAGASLYSAVWGVVFVGLLVAVAADPRGVLETYPPFRCSTNVHPSPEAIAPSSRGKTTSCTRSPDQGYSP